MILFLCPILDTKNTIKKNLLLTKRMFDYSQMVRGIHCMFLSISMVRFLWAFHIFSSLSLLIFFLFFYVSLKQSRMSAQQEKAHAPLIG
jgi:hypothetical protein